MHPLTKDMTGLKFGRWNVLSFDKNSEGSSISKWHCVCECGTYKTISGNTLRQKKSLSCGCYYKEISGNSTRLKIGENASNQWFSKYKRRARDNKLEFTITRKHFQEKVIQNCYYCGTPPSERFQKSNLNKRMNGTLFANGLDRVDNKLGYVLENVVTCCTPCNKTKTGYSKDFFINHAHKITRRNNNEL